jgi:hypothetical protein
MGRGLKSRGTQGPLEGRGRAGVSQSRRLGNSGRNYGNAASVLPQAAIRKVAGEPNYLISATELVTSTSKGGMEALIGGTWGLYEWGFL